MHWHWQNLNDGIPPKRGGAFRHGRAWFDFTRGGARVEWHVSLRPDVALTITEGEEQQRGLQLHIAFFVFSVWLTLIGFRWLPLGAGKYHEAERTTGFDLGGQFWRAYWRCNDDSVEYRDGKRICAYGRYWSVFLLDALFGHHKHSRRVLETVETMVPMPERAYPCTVKLELAEWKRPRWPFARRLRTADVDIPQGVPHPGKGENSWDCGEDATYGLSCPASTVEEAVAAVVETVLKSRRRYGGVNWRPEVAS
jgi:hypothetical protein